MICFGDSWPFEITGMDSWNIIIRMKFGKNIKANTSLFVKTTRFEEQGPEFQFCISSAIKCSAIQQCIHLLHEDMK